MKREVLAIRHVYFEDLGSLELVLGDRGHLVRYLDVGLARIDAPDPLDPLADGRARRPDRRIRRRAVTRISSRCSR